MVLDQSGMYAATSCTDKTLAIYEYESGDIAATMFGHSELVTGLKFTNDCKHLVSVSGKSNSFCINEMVGSEEKPHMLHLHYYELTMYHFRRWLHFHLETTTNHDKQYVSKNEA